MPEPHQFTERKYREIWKDTIDQFKDKSLQEIMHAIEANMKVMDNMQVENTALRELHREKLKGVQR